MTEWNHAGFFAFRTPLLPVEEMLSWGQGIPSDGAEAWRADRERIRAKIRALLERPEVREALFVASPTLEESLPIWLGKPDSERGQKVEHSLLRYLQRMAGRSTPFGLFAGTSVGRIGKETRLRVEPRDRYRRHTRLDMGYVTALAEALVLRPELRKSLRFFPNSSLYKAAGRYRYHESRWSGRRILRLVGLEATEYLEATLDRARDGATIGELAGPLGTGDVTLQEAEAFVGELIESQILVSDLLPPVTGPEPIHAMAELLHRNGQKEAADRLEWTRRELEAIDRSGLAYQRERYLGIAERLKEFSVELDPARLFQVDLFKSAPDSLLGGDVVQEVLRGIELFRRLDRAAGRDPWAAFKNAFRERYEEQEIPLVEALDEEVGIGYDKSDAPGAEASPLLDGLLFPAPPADSRVRWGPIQGLGLRKLEQALREGADEISIEERDLKGLDTAEAPPLPDAFTAFGTLYAASAGAVAEGRYRLHLKHASGPSGMQMLGRFCHLDEGMLREVREFLRREEEVRPDAIHAEIVHCPAGRVGNVIARPVLRGHEIPFLGRAAVAPEFRIQIADLLLSIRNGRVVLRSRKLGREIVPRMTNAHNVGSTGLGLYKFLSALQYQGVATALSWDWGGLSGAPFLPRVVSGRLILALARWVLYKDELEALSAGSEDAPFRAVQELRRRRRLPRFVAVEDADNTLPVDLDNPMSVETFLHLVKERPQAVLVEMRIGPEDNPAEGPEGRFVHELVVPILRVRRETAPAPVRVETKPAASIPRKIAPGGEWLYAKLYCGTSTADRALREIVGPVAKRAQEAGLIDHWFFIRYGDPDWHLRVRFHGAPAALTGGVLPLLHAAAAPMLAEGSLHRIQLDTYHREIERYGGPDAMLVAERIFHVDSEAVLAVVERISGDEGLDARWRLALVGMDLLLDDLGLEVEPKMKAMEGIRDSLRREFRAAGTLEAQIGQKFRQERPVLEAMLDPAKQSAFPIAPGVRLLRQRSERLRPWMGRLRELGVPAPAVAFHYLHMHANRLLRSAARPQELVMADYLARLYRTAWAKKR